MLENVSWLKTPIVEYPPNHWIGFVGKIFTGKTKQKWWFPVFRFSQQNQAIDPLGLARIRSCQGQVSWDMGTWGTRFYRKMWKNHGILAIGNMIYKWV